MGVKRAAVLVGCNYRGTLAELQGCVNDVWAMHATLRQRFHFNETDIQVLVDNDPKLTMPTGANIRQALRIAIASTSGPGDVVFFHFSGHGTQLPGPNIMPRAKLVPSQYDECIVPCDMNLLTDEDMRELVDSLPHGVNFTIVADSCHSGGLVRYEKEQIGDSFAHRASSSSYNRTLVESGPTTTSIKDELVLCAQEGIKSIDNESSRSLPPTVLIEILRERSKMKAINISTIRHSLVAIFKQECSIKFRNSISATIGPTCSTNPKDKKLKSSFQSTFNKPNNVHEGCELTLKKVGHEDSAILISACQAYEVAQDVMPSCAPSNIKTIANTNSPHGAMSYTILNVLSQLELNTKITNYNLVMRVREILIDRGLLQQHPGLYCCDAYVNAPFIDNDV